MAQGGERIVIEFAHAQLICPRLTNVQNNQWFALLDGIPAEPETCGGVLMPEVVFFGGTVPSERVQACYRMIDEAGGLVVIGSSLSVYSGFRFCRYAIQQGKPLIILNVGQTRADELCVRKFDDDPFSTLSQYVAQLDSQTPELQHV